MNTVSEKLYVADASVLIDIYRIEYIDYFYALGAICTSDYVFAECLRSAPEHASQFLAHQSQGILGVLSMDASQTAESMRVYSNHRGHSPADCSVFVLAKALPGILLTSDRKLKQTMLATGRAAHGLLYCMQRSVNAGDLSPHDACACLRLWSETNTFAPRSLIDQYIRSWGG